MSFVIHNIACWQISLYEFMNSWLPALISIVASVWISIVYVNRQRANDYLTKVKTESLKILMELRFTGGSSLYALNDLYRFWEISTLEMPGKKSVDLEKLKQSILQVKSIIEEGREEDRLSEALTSLAMLVMSFKYIRYKTLTITSDDLLPRELFEE